MNETHNKDCLFFGFQVCDDEKKNANTIRLFADPVTRGILIDSCECQSIVFRMKDWHRTLVFQVYRGLQNQNLQADSLETCLQG